ncbi:TPR repeat-containing protein, partial [Candidatus Gastranaerophilus sp. (ex Termes propinquus)]
VQAKKYDFAAALYKSLVAVHPEKIVFQKNLMDCLVKLGQIPEALDIAQKLLKLSPGSLELTKQLARLFRLNNQPYQALELITMLLKRGKIDKELYFEKAFCHMQMGDFEEAKNAYRKVIQLDPKDALAHKELALLYVDMNLAEWAEDELKTALELDGENDEILAAQGLYLHKVQQFEQAQEFFEKAALKSPDSGEYYFYL